MLLFRGLTMVVLNGQSIAPFPKGFQRISSGFIPDWFGGSDLHILTIVIGLLLTLVLVFTEWRNRLAQQRYQFSVISAPLFVLKLVAIAAIINLFTYVLAAYEGIPNILIVLFVLVIIYTFVMNKTVMGRHIYALGGNENCQAIRCEDET